MSIWGNETGSQKLSGPQREDLSSGYPTMQGSNQPTLECWNIVCSKFINYTFLGANNKGADQTLGEPKSLGLNWNNRRDSYIRKGLHCNCTASRCSYICKVKTFETRHVNYKKKKTICQFEGMKLDHRNYLDLNEKTCLQGFRPYKAQTNLLSYRD